MLANIAWHVLSGLRFLHEQQGRMHRDIKPSNLLINRAGEVKITDFGISRKMEGSEANSTTYLGTLMYMSPERVNGGAYGFKGDIWSLGLSLLTCALGGFPLPTDNGYWGLAHAIRDGPNPVSYLRRTYSDDFTYGEDDDDEEEDEDEEEEEGFEGDLSLIHI